MQSHMQQLEKLYHDIWPVDTGYDLIRIGGTKDGSYLLPNVLEGIQLCLSPGTAGMIDFELCLAESYGIPSLLCDPNETAPLHLHPLMKFDQVSIAVRDTPNSISIQSWMDRHGFQDATPLLLSMDIEGAEVEIINNMGADILSRIRVATIEFHYLHILHVEPSCHYAISLFDAIKKLRTFFDIVHFKPNNNCPFLCRHHTASTETFYTCFELTFLNKQLRRRKPIQLPTTALPHMLDTKNVSDKASADYSSYVKLAFGSP
jgi:hypothetical protein